MTKTFVKRALDATKIPAMAGAYVLVHGTPGDGAHHFVSGELDARDGAKPFLVDLEACGAARDVKHAMDAALASGQSVLASGIDHLDEPSFKVVVAGLEKIAATGRHAVAVSKASIEGKELGNVFYARFDAAPDAILSETLKSRLFSIRQEKAGSNPSSPSSPSSAKS